MSSIVDTRRQEAGPVASPPGGPAGTPVMVRVDGLPPGESIVVGFGGIGSPHEIMGDAVIDADGRAELELRIPAWVEANRTYLFYWAWADMRPVSFSSPFLVTGPEGAVRVGGTLTDEGVTCPAMRGGDDTLYTLAGSIGELEPGARVTVVGHLAEVSICSQGLTLAVDHIEPAGG